MIDDDPSILSTVAEILDFEGYNVVTATNGAEGLALLAHIQPKLILLDMRMPVVDGWTFARELQNQGIRLPLLVMTAAQDARNWASEIKADGYLAKPFDLLELVSAVDRLIAPPSASNSADN